MCLFPCPSVFTNFLSLSLSICLILCLPVCLSVSLSLSLCVSLSLSLSFSLSLSLSFSQHLRLFSYGEYRLAAFISTDFESLHPLSIQCVTYMYTAAAGQPIAVASGTKIAATWFADDQRVIANALISLANPAGMMVAYITIPNVGRYLSLSYS